MTMRILAVLAEVSTTKACLEGALAAALIAPDAEIEALHVKVDPDKLAGAPEEIAIQRLREREEGTVDQRALAVRMAFDRWLSGQSPADAARVHWRELVGAEAEKVLQEANTADLLVLARPHDLDAHDAMHAILFSTTRPLLIPPDWSPSTKQGLDGHIVIAWKPTAQARQAVEGAAPWLRQASKVTVFVIAESAEVGGLKQAELLLHELGIRAEPLVVAPESAHFAEQILKAAHNLRANAIVMGAYRHNQFIEWALGSTTRHILAEADIPLFMAH